MNTAHRLRISRDATAWNTHRGAFSVQGERVATSVPVLSRCREGALAYFRPPVTFSEGSVEVRLLV